MRIRMTVAMPEGATRDGEPWPALGDEADVPTIVGAHLVAAGVAEDVTDQPARRRRTKEVGGGADGGDP
ncbi:hypothetical protein [Streptomyces sp. W1SF4]|uniref:hypothetical protein n=1 Tax=Streptomyces sp. W1SF4 TaxID=2305220 RepID=UPI000F6C23DA|nr:hypothetical protein [Streptomyces sp. W1SF4]AZM91434.1 hypothetical protein D1J60_25605 [Streptomyces sp. W1SF4]